MTSVQQNPVKVPLESERVKLVPFDITTHVKPLLRAPANLYECMVFGGPWVDEEEFINKFWNPVFADSQESSLYAIYDKTKPDFPDGGFAGMVGYLNTSLVHLSTEIAFITILPAFQRTHVTSNVMGILMQYALNPPTDPRMPGLGLRRLAWRASSSNEKSKAAAKNMGFQVEGVMRWTFVVDASKTSGANGKGLREGDPRPGFDAVLFSVCWDDWEGGVKALVQEKMDRR